jgi:hypothetical protein
MNVPPLFRPSARAWQLAVAAALGAFVGAVVTALVLHHGRGEPRPVPTRAVGQDTISKSDAESLAKVIEACGSTYGGDYTNCDGNRFRNTGLPLGAAAGQVRTTAVSPDGFTVNAMSKTGNMFIITKNASGISRVCTLAGHAGCPGDSTW